MLLIVGLCAYIGYMWRSSQPQLVRERRRGKQLRDDIPPSAVLLEKPVPPAAVPNTQRLPIVREVEVVRPSVTNIIQTRDSRPALSVYESSMLQPPLRRSPDMPAVSTGLMPINIETRGATPDVQQVGILSNANNDTILALYGRPAYRGSRKWMYYTGTDKFHSIKLPVTKNGRDCTGDHGCEELYDGDTVSVKGYDGSFQVTIYGLDAPRYIPYVV